jgi:hypothetical protein
VTIAQEKTCPPVVVFHSNGAVLPLRTVRFYSVEAVGLFYPWFFLFGFGLYDFWEKRQVPGNLHTGNIGYKLSIYRYISIYIHLLQKLQEWLGNLNVLCYHNLIIINDFRQQVNE